MTTDRDTTRIVRSWLRTEEYESADRVLETVLSLLDTTPQRRSWWPSRRFAQMNRFAQAAIAAAAVLVVALVGYNLLPRTGGAGGHGAAPPTSTLAPSASPTPTFPMLNAQASLDGRYTVGSGLASLVTVDVPAGWSAGGDWVLRGPQGFEAPSGMAIRFYPVQDVYKNPSDATGGFLTPRVGPTVADLVGAIVSHPAWTATEPTDIAIDGFAGQLVQLTIPTDATLSTEGSFFLFADANGGQIYGFVPGQTFDIRVFDVAGERIVVEAYHYPGTSASDLAAQRAVVDSIQFDPRP
jgi:hypothetical protein